MSSLWKNMPDVSRQESLCSKILVAKEADSDSAYTTTSSSSQSAFEHMDMIMTVLQLDSWSLVSLLCVKSEAFRQNPHHIEWNRDETIGQVVYKDG